MTINERLKKILEDNHISVTELSTVTGMSDPYIRKILTPGQSFGIEPLKKILIGFPQINSLWLITGRSATNAIENGNNNQIGNQVSGSVGSIGHSISINDPDAEKIINDRGVEIIRTPGPNREAQQTINELKAELNEFKTKYFRSQEELLETKNKIIELLSK